MNTFLWNLELSALGNLDGLDRLVSWCLLNVLNLLYDIVSLNDLSEDDVAAVEPAGDNGGDEKLGAWKRQCLSIVWKGVPYRWCLCQSWPC